jgi:hypothetical protein
MMAKPPAPMMSLRLEPPAEATGAAARRGAAAASRPTGRRHAGPGDGVAEGIAARRDFDDLAAANHQAVEDRLKADLEDAARREGHRKELAPARNSKMPPLLTVVASVTMPPIRR